MAPVNSDTKESGGRSRRRGGNRESSVKKQALEKLKKYRETGERIEYEVTKDDDVYEFVDEDKYAQIVLDRQEEDFIVDDDGGGYNDDGREIFDDDPNEKPAEPQKGKKDNKNAAAAKTTVKSSKITSMFSASSNVKRKKKEEKVTNDGDELLENILNSLTTSSTGSATKSSKTSNRTPSRQLKSTPRRLQQNTCTTTTSSEKKKIVLSKSKHIKTPASRTKIELKDEDKDEEVEDHEGDISGIEEVNQSEDSCYASLQNTEENEIVVKKENESLVEDNFNDDFDEEMLLEEEEKNETKKAKVKVRSEVDWEIVFDQKDEQPLPNVSQISSTLPLTNVNGEDVLRMFWLDAYEDRYNQPGTVFLFGKVWIESSKCYVSCCVAVKNIERQLYVLPRDTRFKNGKDTGNDVEFKDVYEELDQKFMSKNRIMEFKCRKVTKLYAFEKTEVPHEAEYLEVIYGSNHPALPADMTGETFSCVFGTSTSSLELLFLNQKLQGPGWIDLKFPQSQKSISWCKLEAFVDRPSFVCVVEENIPPSPPLTVLSLSVISTTHPKTHAHEIISVCGIIEQNVYMDKAVPKGQTFSNNFCFVTRPSDQLLPYDFQSTVQKKGIKIESCATERAMLGLLLAKLQQIDPDVIVGHDIQDFHFDVLLHRLSANKVPNWSRIGRLKRTNMPKLSHKQSFTTFEKNTACGRLVCDLKISSKELIRCKSYDLTEICSVVLNKQRTDILAEEIPRRLQKTSSLLEMLNFNREDCMYQMKLLFELQVLPLAYQITGICGNVMSKTLLGGRSERNEFLLLHAFSKKNYILPDKQYNKNKKAAAGKENEEHRGEGEGKKKSRKKPTYAGGLVLEPKKGFYDKYILLLDFNSLYPSIIQEYNICFTTVTRQPPEDGKIEEDELPNVPPLDMEAGILPTEIKRLVERRKQTPIPTPTNVKNLLKSATVGTDAYTQYDIRQKALKLTANSMYGCLGFSNSRFFAKPLAALITGKGREILLKTKDLAQGLSLDVIYGDTDSIMINTNSQDFAEVRKIGAKVKQEVNKLYKMVEIDIDGIYKSMLLLKKKKYAAVLIEEKEGGRIVERNEYKGLDIVRRDWSELAKEAGNYVLKEILSSKARDVIVDNIQEYLQKLAEDLERDKILMEKFEISKSLTKNPDEYPDKKSLPHVTVAQRMLTQGKRVAVGDTINYIICNDGTKMPTTQRAYHPEEFMKSSTLEIDKNYYLSSQVHPVVARLCEPIEGTDAAFIAQCLGLDPSAYRSSNHHQQTEQDAMVVLMTEEERFKLVDKFKLRCGNKTCEAYRKDVEIEGSLSNKCTKCEKPYNVKRALNLLKMFLRERIGKYYSGWMRCDDQACSYETRHLSVKDFKFAQLCQQCCKGTIQLEYNDSMLYNQLLYLTRLFDAEKFHDQYEIWGRLYSEAKKTLDLSAYSVVNIGMLF